MVSMCHNTFITDSSMSESARTLLMKLSLLLSSADDGAKSNDGWGVTPTEGKPYKSDKPFYVDGLLAHTWDGGVFTSVCMGHCRQSSTGKTYYAGHTEAWGDVDWENAHPYALSTNTGHLVTQHNGFIHGTHTMSGYDAKDPTTDSFKAFKRLREMIDTELTYEHIVEWVNMFEEGSSWVMGIMEHNDSFPSRLHILVGPNTRHLYGIAIGNGFYFNTSRNVMYGALAEVLREAKKNGEEILIARNDDGSLKIEEITPLTYMQFSSESPLPVRVESIPYSPIKKAVAVYTPQNKNTPTSAPIVKAKNNGGVSGDNAVVVVNLRLPKGFYKEEAGTVTADPFDGDAVEFDGEAFALPPFEAWTQETLSKDAAIQALRLLIPSMSVDLDDKRDMQLVLSLMKHIGDIRPAFAPYYCGLWIARDVYKWSEYTHKDLFMCFMLIPDLTLPMQVRIAEWNLCVDEESDIEFHDFAFDETPFTDISSISFSEFTECMENYESGFRLDDG
jgi:predicted glutamine amidotransferase